MTRDEVLGMEAGRELDELIAAHVFGEARPQEIPKNLIVRSDVPLSPKKCWSFSRHPDDGWLPMPYSTDWNAAGQLMEAVNSRFYYPHWELEYAAGLSMKPNNPQRGVWWVRFSGKTSESLDEPGIYCPAYGLTGPHGIGLAALLTSLPEG